MDVSVEWFPYKDTENRLSDESIPAITVCYEHIFERILFDEELKERLKLIFIAVEKILYPSLPKSGYIPDLIHYYKNVIVSLNGFENDKRYRNENHILNKILINYMNVTNRREFIERQFQFNDKTFNDFNGTQMHFDFFSPLIGCKIYFNSNIDSKNFQYCDDFRRDIQIISPFGKCHTFLSEFNQNIDFIHNNYSFKMENIFTIMESRKTESTFESMRYFNKKILIHPYNELPDITTEEIRLTDNSFNQLNDFFIFPKRIDFQKLPKPYETNCYIYGESNRFQCLNECYLKGYNQKWNCTPNDNHLITIQLNNGIIEPKVEFCHKNINETKVLNNELKTFCLNYCLESCTHSLYFPEIKPEFHTSGDDKNFDIPFYKFVLKDIFYLKIIFNPRITFNDLIINITNILSLWHGISFITLLSKLLTLLIFTWNKIKVHFNHINLNTSWHNFFNFIKVSYYKYIFQVDYYII